MPLGGPGGDFGGSNPPPGKCSLNVGRGLDGGGPLLQFRVGLGSPLKFMGVPPFKSGVGAPLVLGWGSPRFGGILGDLGPPPNRGNCTRGAGKAQSQGKRGIVTKIHQSHENSGRGSSAGLKCKSRFFFFLAAHSSLWVLLDTPRATPGDRGTPETPPHHWGHPLSHPGGTHW